MKRNKSCNRNKAYNGIDENDILQKRTTRRFKKAAIICTFIFIILYVIVILAATIAAATIPLFSDISVYSLEKLISNNSTFLGLASCILAIVSIYQAIQSSKTDAKMQADIGDIKTKMNMDSKYSSGKKEGITLSETPDTSK